MIFERKVGFRVEKDLSEKKHHARCLIDVLGSLSHPKILQCCHNISNTVYYLVNLTNNEM